MSTRILRNLLTEGNEIPFQMDLVSAIKPILSIAVRRRYKTIEKFCRDRLIDPRIIPDLRAYVDQCIRQQMMVYARIDYLMREANDDFGNFGEQRMAISFCRILLNIPPHREVTQLDANLFREDLSTTKAKLAYPTSFGLRRYLVAPFFLILGQRVPVRFEKKIQNLLEFLGLKDRVYLYSTSGGWPSPLYADYKEYRPAKTKNSYRFFILGREFARFPYSVLSQAGSAFVDYAEIRGESIEVITHNKYVSFLETDAFERELLFCNEYSRHRERIKEMIFRASGITTSSKLRKNLDLWIKMGISAVARHEIGHEISLTKGYKGAPNAVGRSFSSFPTDNDGITAAKELMADFAPRGRGRFANSSGPIWWMIQMAKKNQRRAEILYWMMISDYYFYDTGSEESFYNLADYTLPCLLRFVRKDGSVDFRLLEKKHAEIYKLVTNIFYEGARMAHDVFSKSRFQIEGMSVPFDIFESEMLRYHRRRFDREAQIRGEIRGSFFVKNRKTRIRVSKKSDYDKLRTWSSYWVNVRGFIEKAAPDDNAKLLRLMKVHYRSGLRKIYETLLVDDPDLEIPELKASANPVDYIRQWTISKLNAIEMHVFGGQEPFPDPGDEINRQLEFLLAETGRAEEKVGDHAKT